MKLSSSENASSKIDRRSFLKYCAVSFLAARATWAVEEKILTVQADSCKIIRLERRKLCFLTVV